jgi:hypothetical protein
MVRAVIRNGAIEPLTLLPEDWTDGRELVIAEVAQIVESGSQVEAWAKDVEAAMAKIPPEDHEQFEAALAEHEQEAKEYMRRRWETKP